MRNIGPLTFERPLIMGILNVTPDSFSDGGKYYRGGAVEHALQMIDDGADVIDIGGESTRPGSSPVTAEEEMSRIIPVIRELSALTDIPISVDTMKTEVAEAALDAGADIINDVYGLRAEGMMELAGSSGAQVIIMHMHGTPETMQIDPISENAVGIVSDFFRERIESALDHGVKDMILDPGVGFGKTYDQNMELIDHASDLSFGYPVLIAASRKKFLGHFYPGTECDEATVKISMRAIEHGANMVRVHNVKMMCDALRVR